MTRRLLIVLAGFALTLTALSLGACGGSEESSDVSTERGGQEESTETNPTPPPEAGDGAIPVQPEPKIVEPTGNAVDPTPQPWDEVIDDGDGDDTTHLVTFFATPAPCNVVDRVEVTETATTVTVAVHTGSEPGSGDIACAAIAEYKAVAFSLTEPLGQREVVDAAGS